MDRLHDDRSPLPPPPLGARPEGLLDILGIKTGGRYPQHLHEVLQPGLDLTGVYLAQAATSVLSSGGTCSGTGLVATDAIIVPSTENWLVLYGEIASDGAVTAGITALRFALTANIGGATWNQASATSPILFVGKDWAPPDVIADSWEPLTPRFIPAGSRLQTLCTRYAGAGSETIRHRLQYVRLPR